jgi:hypothetical protein
MNVEKIFYFVVLVMSLPIPNCGGDPYEGECDDLSPACYDEALAACEKEEQCQGTKCDQEELNLWCHVVKETQHLGNCAEMAAYYRTSPCN